MRLATASRGTPISAAKDAGETFVLKTIIPSRKMTREYLQGRQKTMKPDQEEKDPNLDEERQQYSAYAAATCRKERQQEPTARTDSKDRRVNG